MRWRRRVRITRDGVDLAVDARGDLAADVNAAIVAGRGESGVARQARSVSRLHIVQERVEPASGRGGDAGAGASSSP